MDPTPSADIAIAGAGIIGLSLALELKRRGASVVLLESGIAGRGASSAAAGMLAGDDPHNPSELHALSAWSLRLYDDFLQRLENLSGMAVPYQTHTTWQYLSSAQPTRLAERSIDPRQLVAASIAAVRAQSIPLFEQCGPLEITRQHVLLAIHPHHGAPLTARRLVHATGAWFGGSPPIRPRKGQMLRVRMPAGSAPEVHRSAAIYVVPRTQGPNAESALIGATEEDAGFDTQTTPAALDDLRARAAERFPALSWLAAAETLESWAGLRPTTADRLPLLGLLAGRSDEWIAGGHYRNGILLAPATAVALADMIEGRPSAIDLTPFSPSRMIALPAAG